MSAQDEFKNRTDSWLNTENYLPDLLTASDGEHSEICDAGLAAKKSAMPISRGHGQDYIDINKIWNTGKTGSLQWIVPLEKEIIALTNRTMPGWKNNIPTTKEMKELYSKIDRMIITTYSEHNISLKIKE